jgi:hypothetical protein
MIFLIVGLMIFLIVGLMIFLILSLTKDAGNHPARILCGDLKFAFEFVLI